MPRAAVAGRPPNADSRRWTQGNEVGVPVSELGPSAVISVPYVRSPAPRRCSAPDEDGLKKPRPSRDVCARRAALDEDDALWEDTHGVSTKQEASGVWTNTRCSGVTYFELM